MSLQPLTTYLVELYSEPKAVAVLTELDWIGHMPCRLMRMFLTQISVFLQFHQTQNIAENDGLCWFFYAL